MFNKLRNLKDNIINAVNRPTFDPSRFDDPLAMSVQWTPIKGGGSNFGTHTFIENGANRVSFKATLSAKIFSFVFIATGLAIPLISITPSLSGQNESAIAISHILFPLLFGVVFTGVGIFMLRSYMKPVVFDKMTGYFWKGWKEPKPYNGSGEQSGDAVRLNEIHAIQIISEYISGDKKSYYSYELNLVLKNSERVNVIDHGNRNKIIEDANKLGNFLGKPVWNAT